MDLSSPEQKKGTESLMRDNTLSARQLYQRDPLLVLIKERLRMNDLQVSAGVMVLPGIVFLSWWLGWASNDQNWLPANMLSALLQTFVLFPLLFLIYQSVPGSIAGLFNTLKANGVIGAHRRQQSGVETYEAFVQQLISWMDRSWWTLAILVIVSTYALYRLLLLEPTSLSPVPYWMRACAVIIYLPLMYAIGMSVVRLLLALIFTNLLFYLFALQVQPLHPDGSGGLGVLGRLLWLSISIMLWEALLLVASVLSSNLHWLSFSEMILLGAIYVALTPALLVGWLIFPHQMMVRARDEALQPLAAEYQRALMESLSSGGADTGSVVVETRRLVALKQRYDLARASFPTWPLETSALSRIAVTIILPILLPLITSLISLALRVPGLP
jgi:hypothetical protein